MRVRFPRCHLGKDGFPRWLEQKRNSFQMTERRILEVAPEPRGWVVFESEDCQPVYVRKEDAVSYAKDRAQGLKCDLHILTEDCTIEEIVPYRGLNLP
jgi:hypothetical protein